MATFTMQLKTVIEHVSGTTIDPLDFEMPYSDFTFAGVKYDDLPVLTNPKAIGLGSYPIFNETYRPILNGKIVDRYFNREIGTETIDDFKLIVRRTMNQIMPYYNKLYESELIPYTALESMRIVSESEGEINSTGNTTDISELDKTGVTNSSQEGSGTSNQTANGKSRAVSSTTPQTMLRGNEDYASAATDTNSENTTLDNTSSEATATSTENTDSTTTSNGTSNNESNNKTKSTVNGYQGIASDLIMRYRSSLLNIDMSIINELQECFMLVLNTGDSYSQNNHYRFF